MVSSLSERVTYGQLCVVEGACQFYFSPSSNAQDRDPEFRGKTLKSQPAIQSDLPVEQVKHKEAKRGTGTLF